MKRIIRVNNRFYDTNTSNKSFLQVAMDLKKLGVKNFFFMLEILDTSLIGVNPHDPNITKDQIARIMVECTRNPWYYLREVCLIPNPGGPPVKYRANRGNIAQTWCILHGIDSWLCLPRQQGKTESVLAIFAWAYSFGTNDSWFIFINKDGDNSKLNLSRLKDQIELLPKYLQFEQIETVDEDTGKTKIEKARRSATKMYHPITKNRITVKPSANSYEKAMSISRGMVAPILHYDEAEFTNFIKTIVVNSVSTFDTASRAAKANGAMYCRVFTSTPGDLGTAAGEEAQELLANTAVWRESIYDMAFDYINDEKNEVKKYIRDNGNNGIVYIEYSYKQIGKDNKWLQEMYNKIGDSITFRREILLHRIKGSSDSPFEREDIEFIMDQVKPKKDEIVLLDHFVLDVYETLQKSIPYIVGIDCSTGSNNDNNAITIINPYTVKPDAEFLCSYIGETAFTKLIITLVREIIPKAIVVIERNSVGDAILDFLLNSSPIRNNLYYDKSKDLVESNIMDESTVVSMLKKAGNDKSYYGVYTTTKSREDMMAILMRRVHEFKEDFVTKNISTDIANLVRMKSGKIAAAPGLHDDSIMSYLIGLYIYYHGNNLAAFGFEKGSLEIKKQNEGIYIPTHEELRGLIPEKEVNILASQELVRKESNYEELMRKAILESQRDSIALKQKGLANNTIYDNTPSYMLESYDDK